jgi:hypothetical protein
MMSLNRHAADYEYTFYSRAMMTCANFCTRHQGGAEVKDLATYFKENFDTSSSEYSFVCSAQTVFLSLLTSYTEQMI